MDYPMVVHIFRCIKNLKEKVSGFGIRKSLAFSQQIHQRLHFAKLQNNVHIGGILKTGIKLDYMLVVHRLVDLDLG